jgi:2-phosphosulfolactate phosphatase
VHYDQSNFDIRCEWGLRGVELLAPISDVIIIVDVLSFTTSVAIAVERGAIVYPFRRREASAADYAAALDAILANTRRTEPGYTLSPSSLLSLPTGTRLVLPSLNGSVLSLATGSTPTFAGCFRNAQAVAGTAPAVGSHIAVIPAGERWPDDTLRPAWEDWIGAGAIIANLRGSRSPEAQAAAAAYREARSDLAARLHACSSGKELIADGFAADVALAAVPDASATAPFLRDRAYVQFSA